jgi:hypothetical protein
MAALEDGYARLAYAVREHNYPPQTHRIEIGPETMEVYP